MIEMLAWLPTCVCRRNSKGKQNMAIEKNLLPAWALRPAGPDDYAEAVAARDRDALYSNYGRLKNPRAWARAQGWPTGLLGWSYGEQNFINSLLESQAHYALALAKSGIELSIPAERYTIPQEELDKADKDYENGDFRWVVDYLREVRRAVEMGVVVAVDGRELTTFDTFYSWAHGRYYALEDDTHSAWIGDDSKHPLY
jgi:hypothetical protein